MARSWASSEVYLSLENRRVVWQPEPTDVVGDSHRVETLLLVGPQIEFNICETGVLRQIVGGDGSRCVDFVDVGKQRMVVEVVSYR